MCHFQTFRRQPVATTCVVPSLQMGSCPPFLPRPAPPVRMARKQEGKYESGVTIYVIMSCMVAAVSGLMFGYAVGISGGVSSMDSFLLYFFPSVYEKEQVVYQSNYCKLSDPLLQAFTSSMYIAGLFTSFMASYTTQKLGRRPTMLIAGCLYTVGAALLTFAQNILMLFMGRVVIGCSLGFSNQAVPIYLSEMAPPNMRGLNIVFQILINGGILVAQLVNFATDRLNSWGWRISFGLGAIPSILSVIGCLMLCETPNSLIERGHLDQGKAVLMRVRGTSDVDEEFQDLMEATALARAVKHPFRNMFRRHNLPPLMMAFLFQAFQQMGGINAIMFYSPVLFETFGLGSNAALYSTALTGAMNFTATIFSMTLVDRFGRRLILLSSGVLLFVAQIMVGTLLGTGLQDTGTLPRSEAMLTVVAICLFVFTFAWSWGPLAWLVPMEMFHHTIRSAAQSVVVCTNLLFAFLMAQVFLSALCLLKYKVFLVFGGIYVIMSAFVYYLVPETKDTPMDNTAHLWSQHWFWKKVVGEEALHHHDQKVVTPLLISSTGELA